MEWGCETITSLKCYQCRSKLFITFWIWIVSCIYLSFIFSKETTAIVFLQRNNCTISWSVPCLSSNNLDIKIPNDALKLSLAVKTLLWLLFWCWILGSWKNLNCKKNHNEILLWSPKAKVQCQSTSICFDL